MKPRGQAMAEFAVAAAVLALLLLGMPIIGRYHELQLATIEGARQLAFRASWSPESRSNGRVAALRSALFPPSAQDELPEVGAMDARFEVGAAPGSAGRSARAWLAPFRLAGSSSFDLRDDALHGADLKVTVASPATLPDPFAGLQIALSSHYELVGDPWASFGPAQVAARTTGLMLTRSAAALRPLLSFGKDLLALIEPAFRDFCPGLVDPEQVPSDRLGAPASVDDSEPTAWRPAC
jgi:hypothetical protein